MELRAALVAVLAGGLLAVFVLQPRDSTRADAQAGSSRDSISYPVSAVSGPSWLAHLGLRLTETHMGQAGQTQLIPSTRRDPRLEIEKGLPDATTKSFVLSGADLYRFNCRSCHGPNGQGSSPEINSLIGPVQATSAAMIQQRMKARGSEVSNAMAQEMAAEADKSLRDRLLNGGKSMPAFKHLRGDEVDALLNYLDQLAGVQAGKHAARLVTESAARVGEHVVKGTCHICHDATGPGVGHMAMMRGITPSLASLPKQQSLRSVTYQVQNGSSGMMTMMGGPRMPSFPYFTDDEIAAAYFYLEEYPPKP